jgi:hypothetical protein
MVMSPVAVALSIDFEPFMISDNNALSSFASSGFTHLYLWMSICLENQIQSTLKTTWLAVNETRVLGHVAQRHTGHRSGQQHITDFFTSTA